MLKLVFDSNSTTCQSRRANGFLMLLLLVGISGCGSSVVVPRTTSGRWLFRSVELTIVCGLDRSGTRPRMAQDGEEVMIGIINEIERGPDPFPCIRMKQWRYVNGIRWDVNHPVVQAYLDRGMTLDRAELEIRYVSLTDVWSDYWENPAVEVRLATLPWGGTVMRRNDRDPGMLTGLGVLPDGRWTVSRSELARSETDTRDVTMLVRGWMSGSIANHGIVFDSSEFGLGDEHVERHVTAAAHVRLVLHFNEP